MSPQHPSSFDDGDSHGDAMLEQRDDLPVVSPSFGSTTDSSNTAHSPIHALASEKASHSQLIPTTIPFSKAFAACEKYRSKGPIMFSSATVSSTSPFYTPPRRRARSSEGSMLRTYQRDNRDDCHIKDDSAKSASELPLEASVMSPQHFFSPLNNMNSNATTAQVRRRKNNRGHAPSLSDVTAASHDSSSANKRTSMPQNGTRRQQQRLRPKYGPSRKKSKYVIPLDHPLKAVWDILTVILSIAHSYLTHVAIRDRQFGLSPFIAFCDAWFLIDILLNFTTERKTNTGEVLSDHRSIVARYLTSWFAVDALSLFPWEVLYVQPLIEVQNRRGILKKSFFRSKAVVRVTRHLRGRHFRWFGTVAKHTKQHGVGAQRLLHLIIKYTPKYWMFIRNMKGVVAIRFFRFVHWSRRFIMNVRSRGNVPAVTDHSAKSSHSNASTKSVTTHDDDEYMMLLSDSDEDDVDPLRNKSVEVLYEDFQMMMEPEDDDDDDDGVPL